MERADWPKVAAVVLDTTIRVEPGTFSTYEIPQLSPGPPQQPVTHYVFTDADTGSRIDLPWQPGLDLTFSD